MFLPYMILNYLNNVEWLNTCVGSGFFKDKMKNPKVLRTLVSKIHRYENTSSKKAIKFSTIFRVYCKLIVKTNVGLGRKDDDIQCFALYLINFSAEN